MKTTMGKPTTVSKLSLQDNFSMKTTVPIPFTVLRRNMFIFNERVSDITVVSVVRREMMSPEKSVKYYFKAAVSQIFTEL